MTYRSWMAQFFRWRNPCLSMILYLCCALGWGWARWVSLELTDPADLVPGAAAFYNLDVSKRVNLYYQVLMIFTVVFFASTYGLYRLEKRYTGLRRLLIPWSWIGVGGILLLYLEFSKSPQVMGQKLWVAAMGCLFCFQVFRYALNSPLLRIGQRAFWWVALLSAALSAAWRTVAFAIWGEQWLEFHVPFFICFLLLLVALHFLGSVAGGKAFRKMAIASAPLFLLPLLAVLGDEIYLILNQREVCLSSPVVTHLVLAVFALLGCIYVWHKNPTISLHKHFQRFLFPATLAGMAAIALYRPEVKEERGIFELANPANAVMRLVEHGEWPIVEALSSHLLSEVAMPLMYVMLNGYDGSTALRLYNFVPVLGFLLVTYFFLARAFRNPPLAFVFVLLAPYNQIFMLIDDIGNHVLFFINLWWVYSLSRSYSPQKLWGLGIWSAFLIVWKIDVALPALGATLFLLLWCLWRPLKGKLLIDVSKVAGVLLVLAGLLALALTIEGIDIPGNFKKALDYFGAHQAHGYATLTRYYGRDFQYHYVFFPVAMFMMLAFLLSRFQQYFYTHRRFLYISLTGLIVFIFINAQRGLVRHSMMEHTDMFISSFFFLTAGLFVYFLLEGSRAAKVSFLLTFVFLLSVLKYTHPKGYRSLFEEFHDQYEATVLVQGHSEKIDRIPNRVEFAAERYDDIKKLMDENYPPQATFIDFSHSPLLYYFTQRRVPSYFNQYLQNTVTDFLQKENIKYLQNFDLPITVFANHPENHWDQLDHVPNTIRYHRLARYLFPELPPSGYRRQTLLVDRKRTPHPPGLPQRGFRFCF